MAAVDWRAVAEQVRVARRDCELIWRQICKDNYIAGHHRTATAMQSAGHDIWPDAIASGFRDHQSTSQTTAATTTTTTTRDKLHDQSRKLMAASRAARLTSQPGKTTMRPFAWLFCISISQLLLLGPVACETCNSPPDSLDRIDCHPEREANESECLRRGCCWLPAATTSNDQPSCFFPADFNCYEIKKVAEENDQEQTEEKLDDEGTTMHDYYEPGVDKNLDMPTGGRQQSSNSVLDSSERRRRSRSRSRSRKSLSWLLERRPDCPASGFHDDAKRLRLELNVYGRFMVNIKISEPDRLRFEPKLPEISLPDLADAAFDGVDGVQTEFGNQTSSNNNYYKEDESSPADNVFFGGENGGLMRVELHSAGSTLRVIHQQSAKVLFEIQLQKLVYSRRFIQLPTKLGSSLLYGLGLHMGESLLKNKTNTYTMFNYGHPPQSDGRSAYASYPFYLNIAQTSTATDRSLLATGALMLNSNAMDVVLQRSAGDEDDRSGVTWRLVGGLVDLFLFAGPEPHDVVQQYQSLVGRPTLPPAWALGYHQSRLNYRQLLQIKQAWAGARSAGIPVESFWTDLDFLHHSTSYTLSDPPELAELVRILQDQFGMHYMALADPTLSLLEDPANYEALKLAISMDLFAYDSRPDGESAPAVVRGWPDRCGLLDFTNAEIVPYLVRVLRDYRGQVNFDGLWLDMNEPEVFANEKLNLAADNTGRACPHDEQLQYWPGDRNLNDRTLCMAAEFEAGKHFDVHNLYAFYQSKAHHEALRALNSSRRPFLVSRGQFVGQGKYSGSWLGDLSSSFEHMRWSLLATIESNWMGQPMVGADICGFFGSTSEELCARWFSLGAFYPLARNHNDGTSRDQDPGSLGEDVQRAARVALLKRYSLLPFLYSLFYRNHLEGEPVVSSTIFSFFDRFGQADLSRLSTLEDQLVWGRSLVVAPVLEQGLTSRSVHLPAGRWYDVSIGLPGSEQEEPNSEQSSWPKAIWTDADLWEEKVAQLRRPLDCERPLDGCLWDNQYSPIGSVNLFLRGGSILPTFRNVSHTKSINELWSGAAFFLEVALDENASATGELFWDSGESVPESNRYNEVNFWATHDRLTMVMVKDDYKRALKFEGFVVYGVKQLDSTPPTRIYRNVRLVYKYDSRKSVLTCLFKSPAGNSDEYLLLERYDNLIIKW